MIIYESFVRLLQKGGKFKDGGSENKSNTEAIIEPKFTTNKTLSSNALHREDNHSHFAPNNPTKIFLNVYCIIF